MTINYYITPLNTLTFPYSYGAQHIKHSFQKEISLKERVKEFILGISEMIPVINYIIAFVDRIFHPSWAWDVITSKNPNWKNVDDITAKIPPLNLQEKGNRSLMTKNYKWYQLYPTRDTKSHNSVQQERNKTILALMEEKKFVRGVDPQGNNFVILSTNNKEVLALFKNGTCIDIYKKNIYRNFSDGTKVEDCYRPSTISRIPERIPALKKFFV